MIDDKGKALTTALVLCCALLAAPVASSAPIHWDAPIQWTPWEQAHTRAKAENKPICLVIYADWCPKCRKIAPFFKRDDLLAASKKAVMVLQNDQGKPEWLANGFASSGNYVPRIFFLDGDGNIDADINSGHQRFPFFYRPNDDGIRKLIASIDKAVAKVGGPKQAPTPQPQPIAAVQPQASGAVGAGSQGNGGAPVAVAPGQPAPPAEEPSDLPILLGLVAFAVGAAWLVGRNSSAT